MYLYRSKSVCRLDQKSTEGRSIYRGENLQGREFQQEVEDKKKRKSSCLTGNFRFAFGEIKHKTDPKTLHRIETAKRGCSLCIAYPQKGFLWTATSKHLKEESSQTGMNSPVLCSLKVPRLFYTVPHPIATGTVRSNRAPVTKVFSVLKSSRKLAEAREGKSRGDKTC